ncbi:MAG TPA: carboxymuconolactone decarboxylase family protein [Pseudonocardiaceae bacterium]|nr:carboxymuconolactone decarboxylase family protein [Pseudonocardiaceae bacterium]
MTAGPRVPPGGRAEVGLLNTALLAVVGRVTGAGRPNLFTTLARQRKLFRAWLRFAARLMPYGTLPRPDTELLILRTAANCDCAYEIRHHQALARRAGLSDAEIACATRVSAEVEWTPHQATLLAAADELHTDGRIAEATWTALGNGYSDGQLIELCLLVGHYRMLAMTIASLGIQPDASAAPAARE